MAGYLRKYVGTYRVKAEYDIVTKDFPRLDDGKLDPSFDDLYIDCANKIQIKHHGGNVLFCYIPTKHRGMNILKKIYQDKVSKTLPVETTTDEKKYLENLCRELVEKEILVSAEVLDFEVTFEFKTDMIEYVAKLVGAKTNGANISPFSSKNLPREPYKIPDKDMKLYRESIKDFPTVTRDMGKGPIEVPNGLLIQQLSKQFDEIIAATQKPGFDVSKDRRTKGLKAKEYIHSFGPEMWQQYCDFLKEASKST